MSKPIGAVGQSGAIGQKKQSGAIGTARNRAQSGVKAIWCNGEINQLGAIGLPSNRSMTLRFSDILNEGGLRFLR